jgi:hypothetical protein
MSFGRAAGLSISYPKPDALGIREWRARYDTEKRVTAVDRLCFERGRLAIMVL